MGGVDHRRGGVWDRPHPSRLVRFCRLFRLGRGGWVSLSGQVRRRVIVLSFDSLATAAVGCYGSSWNQTPAIDAIATGGAVWDRMLAGDDRSDQVLRGWFGSADADWAAAWQAFGARELITDNDAIGRDAKCFDHVVTITPDRPESNESPAADIETTRLAALVAAAIERDAEDDQWSVMWLHSDFLSHAWDAPRSLFPIDEVELARAEPDEFGETIEAELPADPPTDPIFDTVVVPHFQLSDSDRQDPDLITSWMRTYGCQVRLIDWMIEVLLGSIAAEDPIVVVVGTGGFSLGQNGWIGRRAGPLRSPEIRVPLIVSDIGPIRMPAIESTDFVPQVLCDLASADSSSGCWSPGQWVMPTSDRALPTRSDRAIQAVTTQNWFLVQDIDASEHLYLKPDDIDDFNDIARLRAGVVEMLANGQ